MLTLDAAYIEQHLTTGLCIDLMREVLMEERKGACVQYLRTAVPLPNGNVLGLMPGYSGKGYFGAKIISVYPGNGRDGYPSHQGQIVLFGAEHGEVLAVLDAMSITRIRTGAVSAAASRALANPDAETLAILGCGEQGRSHLAAMAEAFPLRRVCCWDLVPAAAERLAAAAREKGLEAKACGDVAAAVRDADIICTLTPSGEPILCSSWVKDGAHINAVGACAPTLRELDSELMARSLVYCDNRESIVHESGDFLIPLQEGRYGESQLLGAVGDVLLGRLPGRRSPRDVTVFDAVGMAVEDMACAIRLYEQAERE